MKVFLLLGCSLLLAAVGGEGQLDAGSTVTQSGTPVSEDVSTLRHADYPDSRSTTPITTTEESSSSNSLRTTPEATTFSPDADEGEMVMTVLSVDPEAEMDEVHEASTTTALDTTTTTTTTTITLAPASTSSDSEMSEALGTPGSTPHPPEDSTPSTASSRDTEGGGNSQHSVSTTQPPPASSHSSTEPKDESTTAQITTDASTAPNTPITTTTTTTTTTITTNTPATANMITTPETVDAVSTSTTATTPATYIPTIDTVDMATDTTKEASDPTLTPMSNVSPTTSQPASTPKPPLGVCFGKTEVNTLVVVAVVVTVNVASVVVTALCVHRIVSRRLTWDPPPVYRHRSIRSEKGEGRTRVPAGRDLASDTECKAGERRGQAGTHIPILITSEDGWCVPYSNEKQEGKKKGEKKEGEAATEDTGV